MITIEEQYIYFDKIIDEHLIFKNVFILHNLFIFHTVRRILLFLLHEEFDPRNCLGQGHPQVGSDVKACPLLGFHDDQCREPGFAEIARDER